VRKRIPLIVVLVSLVGVCPRVAWAQVRAGVRAGVSADPNQFYVGGHVETSPLVEHLSFRPNVEVGMGEDKTVLAMNIEFVYEFPVKRQPWRVYVGGGPAAVVVWNGDGEVGGGFNLLTGFEHKGGLFTEIKVGGLDSPGFKFAVGYNFKR
jgi:hypothetical protein